MRRLAVSERMEGPFLYAVLCTAMLVLIAATSLVAWILTAFGAAPITVAVIVGLGLALRAESRHGK